MKFSQDRFTVVLLTISALSISASAAFFSVYGLSKVFAGAGFSVIVMASILEVSKLIIAYAQHRNAAKIPKALNAYLTVALVVLMIITSAGIYGYLSSAYQLTANKNTITEKQIEIVQAKVNNKQGRLTDLNREKDLLVADINQLRQGFSNSTSIESVDRRTGQRIVSRDAGMTRTLNSQLEEATKRRNVIDSEILQLSASIDSLKIQIIEQQSNNDAAAELGPIIYLSKITGVEMDILINYFILLIVIVFDPLAVCLVLALSYISTYNSSPKVYAATPTEISIPEDNKILNPVKWLDRIKDRFGLLKKEDNSIEKETKDGVQEQSADEEVEKREDLGFTDLYDIKTDEDSRKDNNIPRFTLKRVKRRVPISRIVDNGQKVEDFQEVEEVILEPADEAGKDVALSPEDYNRLIDKYVTELSKLNNK